MQKYDKLYVYTDGGSRGNPGPSAIAIIIFDKDENLIKKHSECIGETTNNRAEYIALIKALELAREIGGKEIFCFSDSENTVKQVLGINKIRDKNLLRFFNILKEKEKVFKKVTYKHEMRTNKKIKMADKLVNEVLNKKT